MDLTAIQQIGRYKLTQILGQGGMGVVYLGIDEAINRPVAIKMLLGGYGGDNDLLTRFHREARSTGNLQHKNIVTVYALDIFEGFPYMVMEYLDGQSISQIISSRRKLHIVEKLRVISQVCEGLQYAHDQKIIHRDIKPANIIVLKDGTAKIVDFGIARIARNETNTLTHTGQIIGSLYYMSPEQFRGDGSVDTRTDIYSTGVTLFQFLTGQLPFQSVDGDQNRTIFQILNEPVPSLAKYLEGVPAELDAIVSKAMAKDVGQRYQTAEDLDYDLSRLQANLKGEMISELLSDAKAAIAQNEFETARQKLQDVLKCEKRDVEANRLFQFVRDQLLKQQRSAQVADLQSQARMAIAEMKYELASGYIEQARRLEPNNEELADEAKVIENQVTLARELVEALRRGHAALISGDLVGANQAVQRALEIDGSHTEARSLDELIRKELEERAKRARLQGFIEQARREISDRNYLSALRSLEQASSIDPADSHIRELLSWAQRGYEQEKLRNQLREYLDGISAGISDKRHTDALRLCDEALKQFPGDASILKLQALARHHHVIAEQRQAIDSACEKARSLTNEDRAEEAIRFLEETLQAFPDEPILSALLANTRSERERRIKEAQEREQQLRELERNIAPLSSAEQTRGAQVLNLLTELQATLNRRPPMSQLSEVARRAKDAISLHGIQEAQLSVLLSEYELRFAKWKNDASELDEIKKTIEHATALAPIDVLVERARFIREINKNDDEILNRYEIVRASAEQLRGDWDRVNGDCVELLRSAQANENLDELQTLCAQMRKTAGRWIEDPGILGLVNQLAERVDEIHKRKERVLEQLEKIRSSLVIAKSSGQVRLLQEQARMVVAVFRDLAVDHFLESVIDAADERKKQIDEVLVHLRGLAAMADSACSIEEIERCQSDASNWINRGDFSEEARELLKRTQRRCQDRKQDYKRTQENLERLVSSAEAAVDLGELDMIQVQRRDLLRLYEDDAKLHDLEARVEQSLAHRRELLLQMTADQSARVASSESPVLSEKPVADNQVEPKVLVKAARRLGWLHYAMGTVALTAIGTSVFIFSPKLVSVRTDPSDAVITLDTQACSNPCFRMLTRGTHRVTVSRPGFIEIEKTVEVGWLRATIPAISLLPAPKSTESPAITAQNPQSADVNEPELLVQTAPEAIIFLDNSQHPVGVTDVRGELEIRTIPGNHQLRVEKDGYEKAGNEAVSVKRNGRTVAFIDLKAQTGRKPSGPGPGSLPMPLELAGNQQDPSSKVPAQNPQVPAPSTPVDAYLVVLAPAGAEIHINQQFAGHSTGTPLKAKVHPGSNSIDVFLAGYQPFSSTVDVAPGDQIDVTAKLSPVPPVVIPSAPRVPADVPDEDRKDIQSLLDRYSQAYVQRNAKEIQAIWPSVHPDQIKKIRDFLKNFKSVRMSLRIVNATPAGNRVTADCIQTLSYDLDGKEQTSVEKITLYLVKRDGGWLIDFIPTS